MSTSAQEPRSGATTGSDAGSSEGSLGQLLRELVRTLGAYLKQSAADAVERVLSEPLRKAARKVLLLGMALGMAATGGVCLALAIFHLLLMWLRIKSAAYACGAVLSLLVGALCAWLVARDGRKPRVRQPSKRP